MSRIIIHMELKLATIAVHFLDKLLNFLQASISNVGTHWPHKHILQGCKVGSLLKSYTISYPIYSQLCCSHAHSFIYDVHNLKLTGCDEVRYADMHRLQLADQSTQLCLLW